MVRSEKEKAHAWLTTLAFLIHDLAICIAPYLPDTASRIVGFLGLPKEYLFWKHLGTTEAYRALAAAQQPLPEPQILFRQLENQTIAELRKHFTGTQQQRNVAVAAETATDESNKAFLDARLWAEKIDLRVGRIIEIKNHPNAERLFVEKIDCGEPGPRTIVSGLREHYQKEELLGKNVAVVVNLKPVKLRGIKSRGMLLAASQQRNTVALEVLHPFEKDHSMPLI